MSPWTSYYLSSKEYYPLYLLSGSTKFEWTHQLIPLFFIISCCDTWGIDIIFLSPTIHIDSSRKYEEFISVQLWSNHSQPIQVALISPSMTLSFFIIIIYDCISRHSVGHMPNQHMYFDTEKRWVQHLNLLPFFIQIYVNFDVHFVERTHTHMICTYCVWQEKCTLHITKTAYELQIYPNDGLHYCVDYNQWHTIETFSSWMQ